MFFIRQGAITWGPRKVEDFVGWSDVLRKKTVQEMHRYLVYGTQVPHQART